MSSKEKKQSIITALVLLMKMDTAARRRGTDERQTLSYYLPLVSCVCRDAWCQVYGVSTATITRYRRQIQAGTFSIQPHRGKMNLNTNKIQIRWLAQWFRDFAAILGDVVPVRVRTQETVNGVVKKRYSAEEYTLLPAFFTRDQLYTEMENYVAENEMDVRTPQSSTFRKLLQKCCPTIRIRSHRSNVYVCSILYFRMKSGVAAELTEELGVHTAAAKKMRKEYKRDLEAASDDHAVIVMDFSQNLTLPSVTATPSQWYFLSLVNVFFFAIYYANKNIQYNYVYEESVASKGTDENKNNFVVKLLLGLAQIGELETIDMKFFVKGRTKNAVDCGFGHIRKKFAREDVWTMDQLLEVVNAASNSALIHVPKENSVMKLFRTVVQEAYKDMKGVQSYQLFGMATSNPVAVSCRASLDSDAVTQALRRSYDGIPTSDAKVRGLFESPLELLSPPLPNFEKKQQMHSKVLTYVPEEYRSDPIYDAPNEEEEQKANEAKQARRKAAAKWKRSTNTSAEAKESTDVTEEGGRGANDAGVEEQDKEAAAPQSGKQRRKRSRKEK
ncbi:uncharacterized protein IUM83_13352 [Phytophthora cinnamomi]|uniref:uncharacterized protein n=1 Tax=Phytophthora cinnamomi TaxID=4785 RepID=UPI00355A2A68|nr:hypothetical protein IUM83_13352 [Phytophthora cinnamomi]